MKTRGLDVSSMIAGVFLALVVLLNSVGLIGSIMQAVTRVGYDPESWVAWFWTSLLFFLGVLWSVGLLGFFIVFFFRNRIGGGVVRFSVLLAAVCSMVAIACGFLSLVLVFLNSPGNDVWVLLSSFSGFISYPAFALFFWMFWRRLKNVDAVT